MCCALALVSLTDPLGLCCALALVSVTDPVFLLRSSAGVATLKATFDAARKVEEEERKKKEEEAAAQEEAEEAAARREAEEAAARREKEEAEKAPEKEAEMEEALSQAAVAEEENKEAAEEVTAREELETKQQAEAAEEVVATPVVVESVLKPASWNATTETDGNAPAEHIEFGQPGIKSAKSEFLQVTYVFPETVELTAIRSDAGADRKFTVHYFDGVVDANGDKLVPIGYTRDDKAHGEAEEREEETTKPADTSPRPQQVDLALCWWVFCSPKEIPMVQHPLFTDGGRGGEGGVTGSSSSR